MKYEQLSFLEPAKKQKQEQTKKYDATICYRCCCNRCKYSVEIHPFLDTDERKEIKNDSCFNCDECYYYGMDNENLSKSAVKFECDKFKMSNYYLELEARIIRKKFMVISS